MKTTRQDDLDKLDQARFTREDSDSKKHIEGILAMVHTQSKDPILEKLRAELVGVLNELEEGGGDEDDKWNRYLVAISKIEKYCNSPAFIRSMYSAINKAAGTQEADKYALAKSK